MWLPLNLGSKLVESVLKESIDRECDRPDLSPGTWQNVPSSIFWARYFEHGIVRASGTNDATATFACGPRGFTVYLQERTVSTRNGPPSIYLIASFSRCRSGILLTHFSSPLRILKGPTKRKGRQSGHSVNPRACASVQRTTTCISSVMRKIKIAAWMIFSWASTWTLIFEWNARLHSNSGHTRSRDETFLPGLVRTEAQIRLWMWQSRFVAIPLLVGDSPLQSSSCEDPINFVLVRKRCVQWLGRRW